MIHVTPEMLPTFGITAGFVTIDRPLPSDALLTPAIALAYADSLIEAAAQAEGDRIIRRQTRTEAVATNQKKAAPEDGLKF